MELDEFGNQLIKYEIMDIVSEVDCSTEYETLRKKFQKKHHKKNNKLDYDTDPIVRVVSVVQSEWGVITETTTYWSKSDWQINKRRGFFYATDDAINMDNMTMYGTVLV